jgi:signal transduction histidine kinase
MVSLFNNLIKNAIQALTEDRPGVIDIYLIEEYGTIKTIIIDNGKGIPDEIQDRIFTPNFTTKNSGSGLGLAISKQIIENAGGSIWFESQENIGTTFYVVLPKYEDINNATI